MSKDESLNPDIQTISRPADLVGRLLLKVTLGFAFFGGFSLLILVAINFISILGRFLFSSPLVGDFELIEVGCAVAVSSFLPLCLLKKGNVTVDIFTARLGPKSLRILDGLGHLIFLIVAVVFAWRMTLGVQDMYQYHEQTMLLQLPIWIPIIPVTLSFYLLSVCAFYLCAQDAEYLTRVRA